MSLKKLIQRASANYACYSFFLEKDVIENADKIEWHAFSYFMNHDNFSVNFYRTFKHDLDWEVMDVSKKDNDFHKEFASFIVC